ncbi:GIY-YIG nuclease family protein [Microbacterium sp. 4R-513]|uniref:GIY-YIG nuclease family protein n=1 Tax=Microbacterium sp. 4R-513 TaxID=2567934 RepID=UPI0013E1DEC0|nr:GIY-YIG nuclease family protein [Microbacterium sp. 4R-513]QIG38082.1 GIY-YIG nuclease family protein [Microbacterium sp. 4R-513]
MASVYILRCSDGSYYFGSTDKELEARVWEHNNDEDMSARYTIKRRPVVLVYSEQFDRIQDAFVRERQLHGWSRAKKEALMDGRIDDLRGLSRSRGDASVRRRHS